MRSVKDLMTRIKKTGCTISQVATPVNMTYLSFDKSYVDMKLSEYAKNPANEYSFTVAFDRIYRSKRNRFCPSVIGENDQLFKVEKVYALQITQAFSDACGNSYGSIELDLCELGMAVSNIIGKDVFVISPVAYRKESRLWSAAARQYLDNLSVIHLVCLDDLTPTHPVTSTKRAESIYKRKRSREADKKIFEAFFKPMMKATLDEAGFYYDDHTKKVYTNSRKFTNWINKFVEEEVISKLKEAGIDAKINPNGYYNGAGYPIIIKGVDKVMLNTYAQQIEGEQDDQQTGSI